MEKQYAARRKSLAESLEADIDRVPVYRIKTPLQRSIQLLKRHRDVVFENKDDKPASIIITTLAAHSYNDETDLVEALSNIIDGMPDHIAAKNGAALRSRHRPSETLPRDRCQVGDWGLGIGDWGD